MKERIQQYLPYMPGAMLILIGFVIILFPMLLVVFISSVLVLAGIAAISLAHHRRQWLRHYDWRVSWDSPFEQDFADSLQRLFLWQRW
ncbi:MAG: hypothetical protein JRI89_13450 [Deltaproteobacteria bacterium]|nr:hypothetical protein [Deltaproteobacteria bacterium]